MELILKNDVDNLGFVDDVVRVKNGYGRNFLIPRGHAVLSTPSTRKQLEEKLKQQAYKERKNIQDANSEADKLKQLEVKMTAKAGSTGKMFGSITAADLSEILAKNDIDIDKRYITIQGGNIKRLGQYEAKLRFHREVIITLTFDVVAEA